MPRPVCGRGAVSRRVSCSPPRRPPRRVEAGTPPPAARADPRDGNPEPENPRDGRRGDPLPRHLGRRPGSTSGTSAGCTPTATSRPTSAAAWRPSITTATACSTSIAGRPATCRSTPPTPPDGNRLYRNLGGGTFGDVTESAGVGYRGFNHGAAVGRRRRRRLPRPLPDQPRPNVLYPQQRRRHVLATRRPARASTPPLVHRRGVPGLRRRRPPRPLRHLLRRMGPRHGEAAATRTQAPDLLQPVLDHARPPLPVPEPRATGRSRTRPNRPASSAATAGGSASSPPTSTATAGPTSTSPTTAAPTSSSSTTATARSGTPAESSGAATNEAGEVQGSMGVDAEDVDGDGLPELLVTNFRGQYTTLYQNHGGRQLPGRQRLGRDRLRQRPGSAGGAASPTSTTTACPTSSSSTARSTTTSRSSGQDVPFDQPAIVWRNQGEGRFRRVRDAGPVLRRHHVARARRSSTSTTTAGSTRRQPVRRAARRPPERVAGPALGPPRPDRPGLEPLGDRRERGRPRRGPGDPSSGQRRGELPLGQRPPRPRRARPAERVDRVEVAGPAAPARRSKPATGPTHLVREPAGRAGR